MIIFRFQFPPENFKILKLYDIGIHWIHLHVTIHSLSGSSCISKKHESGSLLSWPGFCLSLLPTCSVESDEGRLRDFISTYFYSEYLVSSAVCVDKLSRAAEHGRCVGIELWTIVAQFLILSIFLLRNKTKPNSIYLSGGVCFIK